MRESLSGTLGYLDKDTAINWGIERAVVLEAYMRDYTTPLPTFNALFSNSFTGDGSEGRRTKVELGELYLKGWTVFVDGEWRSRISEDPVYGIMVNNGTEAPCAGLVSDCKQ